MKSDSMLIVFLLAVIGLLLANMLGWLPQPGGGQPTALPQVIVVTAAPNPQLVPVNTVVPGLATAVFVEDWAGSAPTVPALIVEPPATWTAVPPATPTPLPPSTGLLAVVARHGETAVQRCTMAMAADELLDLECRTIQIELQAIGQGGTRP